MKDGRNTTEIDVLKLLLSAFKLVSIARRDRIPNIHVYSDPDLTSVKRRAHEQSSEGNLNVMERERFNSFKS
jgi:hypothetical protein